MKLPFKVKILASLRQIYSFLENDFVVIYHAQHREIIFYWPFEPHLELSIANNLHAEKLLSFLLRELDRTRASSEFAGKCLISAQLKLAEDTLASPLILEAGPLIFEGSASTTGRWDTG
jgi:hypothetical protein